MKRTAVENWKQSHDAVIPPPTPAPRPESAKARKIRLTTMVGAEAANLARNAVYWTPRLTMSALIERALVREVKELEKERGKPFPQRERELPSGRPYLGAETCDAESDRL